MPSVSNPSNKPAVKSSTKMKEAFLYGFLGLSAVITVGFLLWLIAYVIIKGMGHIDISGLIAPIVTTIYMVGIGLGISVPIGIGTAIYLNEYSNGGKFVQGIRFATECLAAVPSILFGLFGMMFFVRMLGFSWSILSGGLTISIMILPTVVKTTEEALKTVPQSYREGSLALGASKFATIRKVVLPSATPGILTGVVFSTGRIIGETAAIYLTAGTVFQIPQSVMSSGRTLSVHLYMLAKEGISFEQAYGAAIVLLAVVLALNFLSYFIASRIGKTK
ncbi:MAG: phosphate ABC transporter permease [Epulopiscium sp. Nele67-Bin002]|nr:MAG: phosphate ABC transporter, permease protein PstA [Epulopiscium sp. Nuni2H_MBin001]OON90837.1 MAG: phosphate ABC transporter permease [Epulopiscium sp. Nele67-Bin002]OON92192.1 MAG: phosphate ABC transporter, permease protein PstA [Epulopiscium sp. Nele67-Bin001]